MDVLTLNWPIKKKLNHKLIAINLLQKSRSGDEEGIGEGEDKDEGVYTHPGNGITGNGDLDALNEQLQALADKFTAL